MHQSIEKSLKLVGFSNRFQGLLMVFLFLCASMCNLLMVGPTFIFMNPLFTCKFSDHAVDESQACNRMEQCWINDDFTIVSYAKLYCDFQMERNFIQSALPLGSLIGLIVMNAVADAKGKKLAMIYSLALGILGVTLTILGSFIKSVILLIMAQFICGFAGYSIVVIAYVIPYDLCDESLRKKTIIVISFAWSFTTIIIGLCYYYFNQWSEFLIVVLLIPLIGVFLISLFFLVQSPQFLYQKGRLSECLQVLEQIALYNRKTQNIQDVRIVLQNSASNQHSQNVEETSFSMIFRNKQLLKRVILFTIVEIGANIYYSGSNFALDQLGYAYGTNMIIAGLVELAAYSVLVFIVGKISEKKAAIIFYSGVQILSALFAIPVISESEFWSMIILGMIRFLLTTSYTILVVMVTDSFPSSVRILCAGVIEGVSQIGNFVAPFLIIFSINMKIHPIFLLSLFVLLFVLIPIINFKPLNENLPNSSENNSLNDPINGEDQIKN